MKISEGVRGGLFWAGVFPGAVLTRMMGSRWAIQALRQRIAENGAGMGTASGGLYRGTTQVLLALVFVAVWFWIYRKASALLYRAGIERRKDNSRSLEARCYPVGKQTATIAVCIGLSLLGAALLDTSAETVSRGVNAVNGGVMSLLKTAADPVWESISFLDTVVGRVGMSLVALVGVCFLKALPFLPRRPEKDSLLRKTARRIPVLREFAFDPNAKTYDLEMHVPFFARRNFIDPRRVMMKFFRGFMPGYLNAFTVGNRDTVFAGKVTSVHNGEYYEWWVSYDKASMLRSVRQREITAERCRRYLDALGRAAEGQAIPADQVEKAAAEYGLAGGAERKDGALGDLAKGEVRVILKVLARSDYRDVASLDVERGEGKWSQESFNQRLDDLVRKANLHLMEQGGAFRLVVHIPGKATSSRVLTFTVDLQESLRASYAEFEDKISVRSSLLNVALRGAQGGESDADDEDEYDEGDTSSVLDRIVEIRPSAEQRYGAEHKGFGRSYEIQIGHERFSVDTEYLMSVRIPGTSLALRRMSVVRDGGGKAVGYRYQTVGEIFLHLLSCIGLGKEYAHLTVGPSEHHGNTKLALGLLCLDVLEQQERKVRKQVGQAAPIMEKDRQEIT